MRHALWAATIAVAIIGAYTLGILQPFENALTSFRFTQITRPPTGQVVLVDIDAKSLAAIGTWPWKRSVHADIITDLHRLGASDIAVDIDFSTASTPADDAALELALKAADGSVILAAFKQALAFHDNTEIHANTPIPRFAANSWLGAVNVRADSDGKVRRFAYGETIDGSDVASIPALLGGTTSVSHQEFVIDLGIDANAIDRISAIDLLRGEVAPARISGKKVIYGAAAVELRDVFQVPVYGAVSGPMVQALSAESILQGRALTVSGWAFAGGGTVLLALLAWGLRRARWIVSIATLAGVSLAVELAALAVQARWPLILDTSALQAASFTLALSLMVMEIGFRRILLAISNNETRNTETILARVISDNFAGVVVAHEDGSIRAASASANALLKNPSGLPLTESNWRQTLPPALRDAIEAAMVAFRSGRWSETGPEELVSSDEAGGETIIEYVVRPSKLGGGVSRDGKPLADRFIATLTFADVTARRKSAMRLAYLAQFDTLTGLPNRNQFSEALDDQMAQARGTNLVCAVLFFDLDRFKTVNDTLGHNYGDLLLRAVADRVTTLIGPEALAARLGGDEYAIVMIGAPDRPMLLADELIQRIGEPYAIEGHRLIIGVSIGIGIADETHSDGMQVMKNADLALYRAKAAGGNTYRVYEPGMDAGLKARQLLEVDLWDAFEHRQFEVHYQPQVDIGSQEIIGVEALLRWRHPVRGYVSPVEFIPVAEAVGLIEPLGALVMRQACVDAASWPRRIKVAVNVSPVQFLRGDIFGTVTAALAESGLPPRLLDLEITESLFVNENAAIRETVRRLQDMGISFSIDDFGTGYSSLSYIRKFAVQKLKIDRSFVIGLPFDKESAAIVRAVAALATSLEIRVNAEGIETAEQASALRLLGCNEGQGYLFGKPMPSERLADLLRDHASHSRQAGSA